MIPGEKFPVMEIFGPTIQGEGAMAGKRCHFVRFGGCDYRCSWCDSMHAVTPELIKLNAQWLLPHQIVERLEQVSILGGRSQWVTLSGGNPGMWDLTSVVEELKKAQWKIAVETQGSERRDWLEHCDLITVSPKGPSSGMHHRFNMRALGEWLTIQDKSSSRLRQVVFKIVIFTPDDLAFAREIRLTYPFVPFYLSVGTPLEFDTEKGLRHYICEGYKNLSEMALKDDAFSDVTILPQLHVLAWGQEKGR